LKSTVTQVRTIISFRIYFSIYFLEKSGISAWNAEKSQLDVFATFQSARLLPESEDGDKMFHSTSHTITLTSKVDPDRCKAVRIKVELKLDSAAMECKSKTHLYTVILKVNKHLPIATIFLHQIFYTIFLPLFTPNFLHQFFYTKFFTPNFLHQIFYSIFTPQAVLYNIYFWCHFWYKIRPTQKNKYRSWAVLIYADL